MMAGEDGGFFVQSCHDDDQVEMAFFQLMQSSFLVCHRGETGCGKKVQLEIFTEYLPGELSFPFDGVGVVVVGDEQDFFNLEGHEFLENVAVTLFPLVYFIQVYFFHDVLFCTKLKICWRNGKRK